MQTVVVGALAGSPFALDDGKIRVFAHYGDTRSVRRLTAAFGVPDGSLTGTLLISGRSIQIDPGLSRLPYTLKFDGQWIYEQRYFDVAKAEASVARSEQLGRHRNIVSEPTALVVPMPQGNPHVVLYREPILSDAEVTHFGDDDTLLPLSALMDDAFYASEQGRKLFPDRAARLRFWSTELPKQMAGFTVDALFRWQAHFELHSQNVDVVIAPGGIVRAFKVKDLLGVSDAR